MIKKLRLALVLTASYIKTHWTLFFAGLAAGLLLLYFSPQYLFPQKFPVIGLVGNYTPSSLPLLIQNQISVGLTKVLSDGQIASAAAKSWQFSDEGKTVTFDLDTSLVWQNGEKFTAQAINYNLKSVQLTRPAADKVQLTLKEPFAPLLAAVSQPLFKNGLIGLGQWRVVGLTFTGRFLASVMLVNRDSQEKKTYKFFPNDQALAVALKLGTVNQANGLHAPFGLENDAHYEVNQNFAPVTIATLFFNLQKDILDDKSFRRALVYALPNDFPAGQRAFAPQAMGNWVESKSAKKYPQNLKLAKNSIEKIASQSGKIKITLSVTKPLEETAKVIAGLWDQIGLSTTIDVTDVTPPTFDVYLDFLELTTDPDQYSLWHSTQNTNISHYRSPKVDKLLEEGRRTLDPTARKEIYSDFQKAITEDVPAAFLFYPNLYTVKRK